MAWDEWEQLKAEVAARRQGNQTELNSAGGAGDAANLKASSPAMQAAVKALTDEIRPGVHRSGGHADDSTNAAEREFRGWATGSGLKDAHEKWAQQIRNLKGRLAQDQTDLTTTDNGFRQVDQRAKSAMSALLPEERPEPRREA